MAVDYSRFQLGIDYTPLNQALTHALDQRLQAKQFQQKLDVEKAAMMQTQMSANMPKQYANKGQVVNGNWEDANGNPYEVQTTYGNDGRLQSITYVNLRDGSHTNASPQGLKRVAAIAATAPKEIGRYKLASGDPIIAFSDGFSTKYQNQKTGQWGDVLPQDAIEVRTDLTADEKIDQKAQDRAIAEKNAETARKAQETKAAVGLAAINKMNDEINKSEFKPIFTITKIVDGNLVTVAKGLDKYGNTKVFESDPVDPNTVVNEKTGETIAQQRENERISKLALLNDEIRANEMSPTATSARDLMNLRSQKLQLENQDKLASDAQSLTMIDNTTSLLDEMLNTENTNGLENYFGATAWSPTISGTDKANFRAKMETLKSNIFNANISLMKGMGALSDAEGAKVMGAMAALDKSQSDVEARRQLEIINAVFGDMKTKKENAIKNKKLIMDDKKNSEYLQQWNKFNPMNAAATESKPIASPKITWDSLR